MALFTRAVKQNAKLRFAVSGPAGSGKTFTLLKLATELAEGGGIAYVDTEHGSASKYAHTAECGANCVDPTHFIFDKVEPSTFDPRTLTETIDAAVKSGYAVFCCDSLSHYWMGPAGELELVDNAAKQMRNPNSFAAWKTVTPLHNALVDKMLSAPIHILVSMRTKTEWVLDKDEKTGKTIPRKIGLQPIMRDGIEFEFDVCGDMNQDNTLVVTKSRCPELSGKSINRPGREMAQKLQVWLGSSNRQVEDPAKVMVELQHGGSTNGSDSVLPPPTQPPQAPTPVEPEAGAVPVALRAIFAGMHKPGYVRGAMQKLKDRMVDLMPDTGAIQYEAILQARGIRQGSGNKASTIKAALLEMYHLCEFAEKQKAAAVPFQAADDDLSAGLFLPSIKEQTNAD